MIPKQSRGTATLAALATAAALVLSLMSAATAANAAPTPDDSRQVYGWGSNEYGSLGDGTDVAQHSPVSIGGLTDVVKIVPFGFGDYAIRADGTVWAWGLKGETDGRARPKDLYGPKKLSGVCATKSLTTNFYSTYAVCRSGSVYAWGLNTDGQLGDGTTKDRKTPRKIAGLTKVKKVYAQGWSVFAIRSGGSVMSWGAGDDGGLGIGKAGIRTRPKSVTALKNVTSITGGFGTYLGVRSNGTVLSWGGKSKPKRIAGLTGITKVKMSDDTNYALRKDGTVWVWGGADSNRYGQLGKGTRDRKSHRTPSKVPGLTKVKDVQAGFYYAMALRTDGTLWSWGSDANPLNGKSTGDGALGVCGKTQLSKPARIPGVRDVTRFVTGGWTTHVVGRSTGKTCATG